MSAELDGEVFKPLRDPAVFVTGREHPVMRTAAWAKGEGLAAAFLLVLIHGAGRQGRLICANLVRCAWQPVVPGTA